MDELNCEILIIGSGPAGLTAGIYCARANRDVIILDGKELSALAKTKEIQNWPGEIDIKGKKLLEKFRAHTESYSENVRIIKSDVISLMLGMGVNKTSTRTANITSDVVIIATGGSTRKELIKGEESLLGFGVSYSALWDGPMYKDKVVYLYGNDEEMLDDALVLHQMGCIVRIITDVGIKKLPEKVYE
jgi:thioredoxin reductase (NADPH)